MREKESSYETFHSDSSNIDDLDDDLIFEQNVDDIYYDKVDSASDGNSSSDGNSENERMFYSYTIEPIVGPEFWEEAPEPMPLPPIIRPQIGRPKNRKNTKNDIPTNATKLPRTEMKMNYKYCKAESNNTRTCSAKKSDKIKKAAEEDR
ncbi:hypothetical protein AgCh_035798 [Apium graveolens]